MNTDLQYREAAPSDKAAIKDLLLLSYGEFSQVLGEENWSRMQAGLSNDERLEGLMNASSTFVCMDGDKAAGVIFLVPSGEANELFQADWSSIRLLGVDPAYRGKGIARRLVQLCLDQARKQGETTIALHTSEFMNAARHIYESLGFSILKEIEPRFGKQYWIYTLQLN